jgi:hypothetical protein
MDNKEFKPNPWQIEFMKMLESATPNTIFLIPRRAGLTTILKYLETNDPELYKKWLNRRIV